jgi:serine/threonine protein phosphatase 1
MYTPTVQHFERNTKGRDFVVGDIHGCFIRLQEHLNRLRFNPERDRLFSTGDLVDRGPESHFATDWLSCPWFHPVIGNHELMACAYHTGQMDRTVYAQNGGGWFIGMTPEERSIYVSAFECLPTAIEVETTEGLVGIVHADVPTPGWAAMRDSLMGENAEAFLTLCTWSRTRINSGLPDKVADVLAVIVGHTPVERFTSLGNVLFIDTGAVFRGRDFTILDLARLAPVQISAQLLQDFDE